MQWLTNILSLFRKQQKSTALPALPQEEIDTIVSLACAKTIASYDHRRLQAITVYRAAIHRGVPFSRTYENL